MPKLCIVAVFCSLTVQAPKVSADGAAEIWSVMSGEGAPTIRRDHVAVWTGQEMIVWGGYDRRGNKLNDGARYNPSLDRWLPMTEVDAPSPRSGMVAVWTGDEMVVWGGAGESVNDGLGYDANARFRYDGGRYEPRTDSWSSISTIDAPQCSWPAETVVIDWTGEEVLIWCRTARAQHGARYNPLTDTWRPMAVEGEPQGYAGAVWTGVELLVWALRQNGAAYDPLSDAWRPMNPTNSPNLRYAAHPGVWTGSRMLAWEGRLGGAYDVALDQWTVISADTGVPQRVVGFSLIWTGREMIVWGGSHVSRPPTRFFGDGSRYDPWTDRWSPIPPDGPAVTAGQKAVWTGREMLVWPGGGDGLGGIYRPYWLSVLAPTQVYDSNHLPLPLADPGVDYRVVKLEGDWALVQAEGDPPSLQQWIALDERVQLEY